MNLYALCMLCVCTHSEPSLISINVQNVPPKLVARTLLLIAACLLLFPQEIISWYYAIRAARLRLLQSQHPDKPVEEVSTRIKIPQRCIVKSNFGSLTVAATCTHKRVGILDMDTRYIVLSCSLLFVDLLVILFSTAL